MDEHGRTCKQATAEPWVRRHNWNYDGRWVRSNPPPFGSADSIRERAQRTADLEADIRRSNRRFWWGVYVVVVGLWWMS